MAKQPPRNVVIVAQGFVQHHVPCNFVGAYLEWVRINDPADKPLAGWTRDIKKAMRFTMAEAFEQYTVERTVSGPEEPGFDGRLVPDGKPNRPLTAIACEFRTVD